MCGDDDQLCVFTLRQRDDLGRGFAHEDHDFRWRQAGSSRYGRVFNEGAQFREQVFSHEIHVVGYGRRIHQERFDNRHDDESRPEVPRPRGRTPQRQLGMI